MDCRAATSCDINASLVIYTGPDLPKINVFSRDRLDTILGKLNGITSSFVKSVNSIKPDSSGNVTVSLSGVETDPVFTDWLNSNPFAPFLTSVTAALTYVPLTRQLTVNGITHDLSSDRTWTITAGVWGQITGSISNQTDLISLLTSYQPLLTTGTTSQYFRGDLSLAPFPTNVSSFTNDSGYITSASLSPYLLSATAASTYVPLTRTLTINGQTFDLSANRTWTINTGVSWGGITGTLSNQTDLQNALNAKQNIITTGTTSQYIRGDLSLATFPTLVSSFTNDAGYLTSFTETDPVWLADKPNYLTSAIAASTYVPLSRTITINGTTLDLSVNRSWTISTGSGTFAGLTDVNLTSLANGDLVKYDSTSSKWINFVPNYAPNFVTDGLVSGGVVTWIGPGYDYIVSAATYYINGTLYSSPSTSISLAAADPTDDRIDLFILTTSGTAIAITGTPSTPPVEPDYDANTQLFINLAVVSAASSSPTISNSWIYQENTEWTTAVNSAHITAASTNTPFAGSKDIEGTTVANGNNITFTPSVFPTLSNFDSLNFQIRSKGNWGNNKKLVISWLNSSNNVVSTAIPFGSSSYGFSSSTTGVYQNITIPLADFGSIGAAATKLRFQASNTSGTYGFFIDNIQLTVTGSTVVTGGTVTSVSSGNLSPLFTTGVANPTTTPAISYTLTTQAANKVFAGPTTGANAAPTFRSLVNADFPTSGVTASTYNNVTVNAQGIITAASNVSYLTSNQSITLSGDITGSGTTAISTVLATVNSNVGSFTNASITVNGKGLITAASSGTAPVTSVGATAPITSTGGTTPTISTSISTGKLIGRSTAGTGVMEELIVGSGLSLSGGILTASGTGGTVTSFSFTNGGGFTGTVTNPSTTPTLSLVAQNAAADGTTKGFATFTASDFNSSSGLISLDYTNGQTASGSQNGFLSSTDWTTFNSKVGTSRAINTTSPILGGGDLSADRTISLAGLTGLGTANQILGMNNAATTYEYKTVSTSGTAVSNDVGVTLTGANSIVINLPTASTTVRGVLSTTDWNTFNSKQAAGNYITALTSDITASGPGSVAATLATVNSNTGSFGSATQVATFTVNGKGLTTAAANVSIQITESQVTNLVSDLALKAPLASPALTGTPTAPTASANNNSTQIATTAYVDANAPDVDFYLVSALRSLYKY